MCTGCGSTQKRQGRAGENKQQTKGAEAQRRKQRSKKGGKGGGTKPHSAKAHDTWGLKPEKVGDNWGAQKKGGEGGGGKRKHGAPRPKAPEAGNNKKPEADGPGKKKQNIEKKAGTQEAKKRTTPAGRRLSKAGGQNSQRKGEAHQDAPGGPPARPGQEEQAHAHAHRTRAWCHPT